MSIRNVIFMGSLVGSLLLSQGSFGSELALSTETVVKFRSKMSCPKAKAEALKFDFFLDCDNALKEKGNYFTVKYQGAHSLQKAKALLSRSTLVETLD